MKVLIERMDYREPILLVNINIFILDCAAYRVNLLISITFKEIVANRKESRLHNSMTLKGTLCRLNQYISWWETEYYHSLRKNSTEHQTR